LLLDWFSQQMAPSSTEKVKRNVSESDAESATKISVTCRSTGAAHTNFLKLS